MVQVIATWHFGPWWHLGTSDLETRGEWRDQHEDHIQHHATICRKGHKSDNLKYLLGLASDLYDRVKTPSHAPNFLQRFVSQSWAFDK